MKQTLLIFSIFTCSFFYAQTTTTINVTLGSSCSTLNIDVPSEKMDFSFHPNPAKEVVFFEGKMFENVEKFQIKIFDVKGVLVHQKSNVTSTEINISNLQNGFYLLNVISGEIEITNKLIINK